MGTERLKPQRIRRLERGFDGMSFFRRLSMMKTIHHDTRAHRYRRWLETNARRQVRAGEAGWVCMLVASWTRAKRALDVRDVVY